MNYPVNRGKASAVAPATCGELVQGELDGRDFLVNSPMSLYAEVSVKLDASRSVHVAGSKTYTKLERAVRATFKAFDAEAQGAHVEVHSDLPRGKGLASSSAELAAGIRAAAMALGRVAVDELITKILLDVDRSTDGVHLDGVTMHNHLRGEVYERFGEPPPLGFIIVDQGGAVETSTFDRQHARAVARRRAPELAAAVRFVRDGFARRDPFRIAMGATISARVNQDVIAKPLLETLVDGTIAHGGLGVNCAHTGTVLGVLFDPRRTDALTLAMRVAVLAGKESIIGIHRLVGGGLLAHALTPISASALRADRPTLFSVG